LRARRKKIRQRRTPGHHVPQAIPQEGSPRLKPIGEVTLAATTRFQAVSHEAFEPPRFGSFVKVGAADATAYGVVAGVQTTSFDVVRTLATTGLTQKHEFVAAAIRVAAVARGRDETFLSEAARGVADLFKDDYDTAMAVVRRLS